MQSTGTQKIKNRFNTGIVFPLNNFIVPSIVGNRFTTVLSTPEQSQFYTGKAQRHPACYKPQPSYEKARTKFTLKTKIPYRLMEHMWEQACIRIMA